jgi:perosamine synthetase
MAHGWPMIPHNRPLITAEDRAAVDAVLSSGWVAQGPQVEALEAEFVRRYVGGGACAVSSGTAALYVALKALGIEAGAKVAVPTYACSALLNAVFMAGASPVVLDVLPDSFCLDPALLAEQTPAVDCVIAVHTYGAESDIEALKKSANLVIEDCCHTPGGCGRAGLLGQAGDAAVFSFYATKVITGGQGGLVWSANREVVERVEDYRQFDCRDSYMPRFNLQMTDIQAAMINSQMSRLSVIRARRQAIAHAYLAALPAGISVQSGLADDGRMPYRFVVLAPDLAIRDALRQHMEQAGINCTVPIERYELLHRYLKLDAVEFPVAERLVDTTLSLPIHLCLTNKEISHIANTLKVFRP